VTITPSQIVAMSDNEIGMYASGGYGPAKRQEFITAVRKLALKDVARGEILETKRRNPGLGDRLMREFGAHLT
jgi:hypothetical protein